MCESAWTIMISVILVNYNSAKDTIECLKSLSILNDIGQKIVVVDNHSSDDSLEVLERARREFEFTLIKAPDNNGFSAGNNIGIEYAKSINSDYFVLLNNDTVVEHDFLEKLVNGFKASPNCGITTSRILYFSNPEKVWYAGGALNMRTSRTEHFHYNCKDTTEDMKPMRVSFASGCCMCISREVIDEVGMLDEDFFLYEEDTEFCHRIQEYGFSIWYIPDSVIYHKVSSSTGVGSATSQYYTIRNKYKMILKCYHGFNLITSFIYSTLQILNRCRKGELNYKYFEMGIMAFIRGEKGRTKEELV